MPSARNPATYAVVADFMTDAACGIMLRKDAVHDVAVQGDVIFLSALARISFPVEDRGLVTFLSHALFPGGSPGAGHFSCTARKSNQKEAAPGEPRLTAFPVLLAVKSVCGSRSPE
jgi:hypothetical protein